MVFNPKHHKVKQLWEKTDSQIHELDIKTNVIDKLNLPQQPFFTPNILYESTTTVVPNHINALTTTIWNSEYWWWRTYYFSWPTTYTVSSTVMYDMENPTTPYYIPVRYYSNDDNAPITTTLTLNENQLPYLCSSMSVKNLTDENVSTPTTPLTRFYTAAIQDSWKVYADGVLIYAGMPYDDHGWYSTTQPASFQTNNGTLFEYCKYPYKYQNTLPCSGGGCDSPAVLRGSFTSGVLTTVGVLYGGHGYTSPPSISVINAPGSGASVSANITNGAVTSVTINSGGSGYPSEAAYGSQTQLWDSNVYGGFSYLYWHGNTDGSNLYPIFYISWSQEEALIPVREIKVTRNIPDSTGIITRQFGYYYRFTAGQYIEEVGNAGWENYLTSGTHILYTNKIETVDEILNRYLFTFQCSITKFIPTIPVTIDENNSTHVATLITSTDIYTIDPALDINPPYSYTGGRAYKLTSEGTHGSLAIQKYTYAIPNLEITTKMAFRQNEIYNEIRTVQT